MRTSTEEPGGMEELGDRRARGRTRRLGRAIGLLNEVHGELDALERAWAQHQADRRVAPERFAKTHELPSLDRLFEAMVIGNALRELGHLGLDASRAEHRHECTPRRRRKARTA
jgi:hypothetical protein